MNKIRVLVVDDSMLFRKLLIDRLNAFNNIEVVGYSINAADVEQKIQQLNPDVVTLDVEMPGMSGIDLLKQLLPKRPIPVILVSSLNISVFSALSAGAIDFVRKPDMSAGNSVDQFITNLRNKIVVAKRAKVRTVAPAAASGPVGLKTSFGSRLSWTGPLLPLAPPLEAQKPSPASLRPCPRTPQALSSSSICPRALPICTPKEWTPSARWK